MGTRGGRTLLGNLAWAPYSAAMWAGTLGWMGLLAGSSLPLTLFRPFESFQMRWPHRQTAWPLKAMLCPLIVEHDPAYDHRRVSVYAQNHVSALDGIITAGVVPTPLCGLENASHLRVPGYGWLLRMSNAIGVQRGAKQYDEIAAAFRERASRGVSILTFPEAHRTLDGKMLPFRSGVFRISVAAQLPIVPVGIRGAFRMLPKGELTFRPSKLHAYVAPQIETEGLSEKDVPPLMERVHEVMRAWVEDGVKRPDLCEKPIERARAPVHSAPSASSG